MARKFGFHDLDLSQAIRHLRIFCRRIGLGDGAIEPTEDLLERVVVSLGVATGQIGISRSRFL